MSEQAASETLAPVEPIAVLPSSEPSEKAAAVAPTASSPPAARRLSALARADDFLAHLQRCMQTRAGADTVLMFACYATRLAGNALDMGGRAALRSSARQLVAALFALPPATTVVLGSAAAATPPAIRAVLDLAQRLLAYSGMISEMRTMGRLWGLLGLYSALKALAAKTLATAAAAGGSEEEEEEEEGDRLSDGAAERTFDGLVAWAQVLCLVAFQACENAAYLGGKKVLPIRGPAQGRLAILSVRFWGAYVAMEAARHLVERGRRLAAAGGAAKTAEERRWQEGWRKAFYRNAAWAPLTMHWGTPGGLLPEFLVPLFALYPATGGMRDLWRSTA